MLRLASILMVALVLAGCTGVRNLPAPPRELYRSAEIPGYPGARDWGDTPIADGRERLDEFIRQIRARRRAEGAMPNDNRLDTLILSGGGSDGPFGAGLLVGWTAAGTRPEFTVVTGISAGALIAPFAFLGPEYDDALRSFTVENSTDTLVTVTLLRGVLDGVGLVDNSKLRQKLRGLITNDMVRRLAEEHARGRRLLIGTTNLDAQAPVYWRVSRIAWLGRDRPGKTADLITKIMIASASIPGAFSPQFFTVEANGEQYSELHVDGGVTNQLFFLPRTTRIENLPGDISRFARRGTMYIIRNTKLTPSYDPLPLGLFHIASRSISTMIKFGGRSDIFALSDQARRTGFGMKVTAVPESFSLEERELFDPAYMQALFEIGYRLGRDENAWTVEILPGGKELDEPIRPDPIEAAVSSMVRAEDVAGSAAQ
ncbi:patatin-like phospholipase family protein [Paralimibaculum aggregatum]|uniref:Patatin-like phospholipase family protein n=1 Tax=Paralimibaculum aggregatum TaxID=3036245 RepID=A0ABQ6LLX0_9RHOB|nr:patatin-like phospholipase family protein [Limibaculum sp. NKW23]GMG84197.1 patatin-like phospholipase family protein [Limibaculum sp. NKW23]